MTHRDYIRIRKDVNLSIDYLLSEQAVPLAGVPGMKMTKTAYVNEVLINDLAKRGHYPPRVSLTKSEIEDATYANHMHDGIFQKVDEIVKEKKKRGHYVGRKQG